VSVFSQIPASGSEAGRFCSLFKVLSPSFFLVSFTMSSEKKTGPSPVSSGPPVPSPQPVQRSCSIHPRPFLRPVGLVPPPPGTSAGAGGGHLCTCRCAKCVNDKLPPALVKPPVLPPIPVRPRVIEPPVDLTETDYEEADLHWDVCIYYNKRCNQLLGSDFDCLCVDLEELVEDGIEGLQNEIDSGEDGESY